MPLSNSFMAGGDDFDDFATPAVPNLPTTIPYPTLIRLYSGDDAEALATSTLLQESEMRTPMAHSNGEHVDQIYLEVSSRFDSSTVDLREAQRGNAPQSPHRFARGVSGPSRSSRAVTDEACRRFDFRVRATPRSCYARIWQASWPCCPGR